MTHELPQELENIRLKKAIEVQRGEIATSFEQEGATVEDKAKMKEWLDSQDIKKEDILSAILQKE